MACNNLCIFFSLEIGTFYGTHSFFQYLQSFSRQCDSIYREKQFYKFFCFNIKIKKIFYTYLFIYSIVLLCSNTFFRINNINVTMLTKNISFSFERDVSNCSIEFLFDQRLHFILFCSVALSFIDCLPESFLNENYMSKQF